MWTNMLTIIMSLFNYNHLSRIVLITFTAIILEANFYEGYADKVYMVEFEILNYSNPEGRLLNGNCCSGYKSSGLCRGGNTTCKPYWKICITQQQNNNNYTSNIIPTQRKQDMKLKVTKRPSIFRNVFNKIFGSSPANDVKPDVNKYEEMNITSSCSFAYWMSKTFDVNTTLPIVLKSFVSNEKFESSGEEKNENKRLLVLVEIWHRQNSDTNDKLISRFIEIKNFSNGLQSIFGNEGNEWQLGGTPNKQNSNAVQFEYRWRVSPTSLSTSELNSTEDSKCPHGFAGDSCNEPICMQGCHPTHGYCEQPGKCQCRFGWTGLHCDYCLTMPGCIHGNCVKPLECKCEEGWTGMFCSIPKCKEGCDPKNGYCTVPGECKCRFGWQGENCSECSTLPGCQHGTCIEPLDCNCIQGWEGMFCSSPICSPGCEPKQGWCRRPNECRCKVGWTGTNCSECVPYPGCQNGGCTDTPWTCSCKAGWGGIICNEKLNWCEVNENPCQNDGTCISVEAVDGNYLCQCVLGYSGRHCEKLKQ